LSGADEAPSAIVKRSVTIAGHSTSISLEEPFWRGLNRIARREGRSVAALLRHIDAKRSAAGAAKGNLSSAIRLFVLDWLAAQADIDLAAAPEPEGGGPEGYPEGHELEGHEPEGHEPEGHGRNTGRDDGKP
jgi:predicted DNA-binding ribbon-helix-helix protein